MAFRIKFETAVLAAVLGVVAWGQTPSEPPQQGVVSAGTGNPYQRARQLPARIMDFKAEPESIKPGQSVTLTWATENPTGVALEPDAGRVTARGVQQFSPKVSTIYTLTVHGPNNEVLTRTVTVNVAGTAPAAESTGRDREHPQRSAAHSRRQARSIGSLRFQFWRPPGRARSSARWKSRRGSRWSGPQARSGEI